MLGVMSVRGATIVAETICSMWEITQAKALAIIDRYPAAQKHFAKVINEHLDRTVSQRMLHVPIFQHFDRKFKTLLALYCERKAYFPGQRIAREGRFGDQLFIVNLGSAVLEKKSVLIKYFMPGSHFGSSVMLGLDRTYFGSLVANSMCHVLVVARTTYVLAMEQYPSPAAAAEIKKTEKHATEALKDAAKKIATKKALWPIPMDNAREGEFDE